MDQLQKNLDVAHQPDEVDAEDQQGSALDVAKRIAIAEHGADHREGAPKQATHADHVQQLLPDHVEFA